MVINERLRARQPKKGKGRWKIVLILLMVFFVALAGGMFFAQSGLLDKKENAQQKDGDMLVAKDKAIIIGALGYLISPLDVMPDAIPIAGLSDDLAVLIYVLRKVWGEVSEDVKAKAHAKLSKWFDEDEIQEADHIFESEE